MSINRGMDKEDVEDIYIYIYIYIHIHILLPSHMYMRILLILEYYSVRKKRMKFCHLQQHGLTWRVLYLMK